jgi:hypothetical protein
VIDIYTINQTTRNHLAVNKFSIDILIITNNLFKEFQMNKTTESTAKTTEKKEIAKVEKPVLNVKALVLPKEITTEIMKTCVVIRNANGNKYYLKGHTLEITHFIPALAKRITKFSDEVIEKCHLGHVTCKMTVTDTADLQDVLVKHFLKSDGIKKAAKVEEKKPVVKAAKKSSKKSTKVADVTPAPAAANDSIPAIAA